MTTTPARTLRSFFIIFSAVRASSLQLFPCQKCVPRRGWDSSATLQALGRQPCGGRTHPPCVPRRGWDSNPRGAFAPAAFRERYLQPLGHLSAQHTAITPHFSIRKRELFYLKLRAGSKLPARFALQVLFAQVVAAVRAF